MKPSISVIIPNLHSPLIDQVIDAIQQQTLAVEQIIVVGLDRHRLIQPHGSLEWINTGSAIPPATARNWGARQARGNYLLFLDADCILAPTAVAELYTSLSAEYAVVSAAIQPETTSYWQLVNNLLAFSQTLTSAKAGARQWLPSYGLLVSRTAWAQIGPFPEAYHRPAGEDWEWSERARANGYQLYFTPRAVIYHRPERRSAAPVWRQLFGFGAAWVQQQQRNQQQSLAMRVWQQRGCGSLAAIPMALAQIALITRSNPAILHYWQALPGMVFAQLGWHDGVRHALHHHKAN